jgi:hypothetical protein
MQSSILRRTVFFLSLGTAFGLTLAPARADGPLQFHTLTPCRLVDTRNPVGPSGGPSFQDNQTRTFQVQSLCGVPVGAKAVAVYVTGVGATGSGYLTLFQTGVAKPAVANLNFAKRDSAVGNGVVVALADQATNPLDLSVFARVAPTGAVHMVLDVSGYFD